jgi:hypothetical protein
MRGKWMHGAVIAAVWMAAAELGSAAPPLTVLQDTLYKADGNRFDGVALIEWKSFRAADGSEIPQHSLSLRIANGYLRAALVPTTNALKPAYYTVRFNSEGRTQFVEFWSVPPSDAPLRLSDVRTHAPIASPVTNPPTTVAIQDVSGLRTELDLRPARGVGWIPSRVAVIGGTGAIEGVLGDPGDCVRVDGTSGPCGTGGIVFVDGETPQGAINGSNTLFLLSAAPQPAGSLALFRNGMLLRQGVDYTVSGNTVVVTSAATPAMGDSLVAWYRVVTGTQAGIEIADLETPTGNIDGVNTVFTLSGIPLPASSLQFFRNGLLQKAGIDYTLAVNTVTFHASSVPQTGDILQASYRK